MITTLAVMALLLLLGIIALAIHDHRKDSASAKSALLKAAILESIYPDISCNDK